MAFVASSLLCLSYFFYALLKSVIIFDDSLFFLLLVIGKLFVSLKIKRVMEIMELFREFFVDILYRG